MKQKFLPIVCAVFLAIAMTVQFFVSYNREKNDLMQQMEYKMDLAQKDFLFEVYDMHDMIAFEKCFTFAAQLNTV